MNSKEKGDVVTAMAIAHYTSVGYQVLIPLGDKQKYDLVIDTGDGFKKVQCKYTSVSRKAGVYEAPLRVMGGNQSFSSAKNYQEGDFDLLFVMTADGSKYEVPSSETNKLKSTITLGGNKYQEYRL